MSYNKQTQELASLFFETSVVQYHTYKSDWVNSIAYNYEGIKSSDFWTSDELWNDFYLLYIQQYTNYDPESWPEFELYLNHNLTYGHNVRIEFHSFVELFRLPKKLRHRLLDMAVELALGHAILTRSNEDALIDGEQLYRASVMLVGFGQADDKIIDWFEWQRPTSKSPFPKDGFPNFEEN